MKNLHITVLKKEQLLKALEMETVERIYIGYEILFEGSFAGMEPRLSSADKEIFLALPYILRKRSYEKLEHFAAFLDKPFVKGVLVRNLEEVEWLREMSFSKQVVLDADLYCFNQMAKQVWKEKGYALTAPYELNERELRHLGMEEMTICAYGNIPMMVTANCVQRTLQKCSAQGTAFLTLKDRYQKGFPVYRNCHDCYNIIYNSVPLSLHKRVYELVKREHANIRLDFTMESEKSMEEIIVYFSLCMQGEADTTECPFAEFTQGHLKRGVE